MFGARLVPEGPGRFVGSDFFMPLPVGAPDLKPKTCIMGSNPAVLPRACPCAPACVGEQGRTLWVQAWDSNAHRHVMQLCTLLTQLAMRCQPWVVLLGDHGQGSA